MSAAAPMSSERVYAVNMAAMHVAGAATAMSIAYRFLRDDPEMLKTADIMLTTALGSYDSARGGNYVDDFFEQWVDEDIPDGAWRFMTRKPKPVAKAKLSKRKPLSIVRGKGRP